MERGGLITRPVQSSHRLVLGSLIDLRGLSVRTNPPAEADRTRVPDVWRASLPPPPHPPSPVPGIAGLPRASLCLVAVVLPALYVLVPAAALTASYSVGSSLWAYPGAAAAPPALRAPRPVAQRLPALGRQVPPPATPAPGMPLPLRCR